MTQPVMLQLASARTTQATGSGFNLEASCRLLNMELLGTYPMGIRQSRALLFSIMLEPISPGLFPLLRDIVSTLNTGKS